MSIQFEKAISAIDAAHALDPTTKTLDDGTEIPYELFYAKRMTDYMHRRAANPSETLQIAIRAQHFRRWEDPRSSFPATRVGYHAWRTHVKRRQAEQVRVICVDAGFSECDAERVAALIRKEDLKSDEETQILEDVACLVFLEDQLEGFEVEHEEPKVLDILRKTWAKMSPLGQQMVLQVQMGARAQELVAKALEGADAK